MNNRQTTKRYLPLLWLCLVALLMSCGTMRKASSSQKTPAEEQRDPLTPEQRRKYDYFFLEALRMKEKVTLTLLLKCIAIAWTFIRRGRQLYMR